MIEQFKLRIPEVLIFGNLSLKLRHWEEISNIVGFVMNPNQMLTLDKIFGLNLQKYIRRLEIISDGASKEAYLEKKLSTMMEEWNGLNFTLLDYKYTYYNIKLNSIRYKVR